MMAGMGGQRHELFDRLISADELFHKAIVNFKVHPLFWFFLYLFFPPLYSYIYIFIHPYIYLQILPYIYPFIHASLHTSICKFWQSLIHPYISSSMHPFINPCRQQPVPLTSLPSRSTTSHYVPSYVCVSPKYSRRVPATRRCLLPPSLLLSPLPPELTASGASTSSSRCELNVEIL